MPIPVPIPPGTLAVTSPENDRVESFVGTLAQLVEFGTSGAIVSGKPAASPMLVPSGDNPTAVTAVLLNQEKSQLFFRQLGFAILRTFDAELYGSDSSGTPGPATINAHSGISAIQNLASTVTITNSFATPTSHILITWHGNTQAANSWVTRTGGSFTVNLSAASVADVAFSWSLKNLL